MSKSKKPLEWKLISIYTVSAAVNSARIALGLRDDEVAEIHKIESHIVPVAFAVGGADISSGQTTALSMDPNVAADPDTRANNEDLEWFFLHKHDTQVELTTNGAWSFKRNNEKSQDYDPPILVGTDVGMVVHNDVTYCTSYVRIYFTRRKANVSELNQVLLKRR